MAKTQGPTYRPSKIRRIRKFGYLAKAGTNGGLKLIKRRRSKGRHHLTDGDIPTMSSKMRKNKLFRRRR